MELSRSSKVKVTAGSKSRKWPFSKSISSAIYGPRLNLIMDYESMGQYLNLIGPDFLFSLSFSTYERLKVTEIAFLHQFFKRVFSTKENRRVKLLYHWIEQRMYNQKRTSSHVRHGTRDCHVT